MTALKNYPINTDLLHKLNSADQVCNDCGTKYGKYSVGCSSRWEGTCDVCGETKAVTEVRDYGYLNKGIRELLAQGGSATYELKREPIIPDDELEDVLAEDEPSYEKGDIACNFTSDELNFLVRVLNDFDQTTCETAEVDQLYHAVATKIGELWEHNCVTYELTPAAKAYHAKYGTWGTGEDSERWEIFRDAYNLALSEQ